MVPRYTRPEMEAIWAPANRYRIWFEIEALAAEGMAQHDLIPAFNGDGVGCRDGNVGECVGGRRLALRRGGERG